MMIKVVQNLKIQVKMVHNNNQIQSNLQENYSIRLHTNNKVMFLVMIKLFSKLKMY